MSSEMAASNAEPFKVVQKRSSNQGRRGLSGSRERYSDRYSYGRQGGAGPRHSGGHAPSADEPSTVVTRKKTPLHLLHQRVGDKADREIRLRPQTSRTVSGQSRSGNSSSASSVGGGSGRDSSSDSYHHTGRHRSSSNSMDGETGKASKAEKSITSPNRFEKLENLDPDVDDSVLEPSSSSEVLKGSSASKSTDAERKRDREKSAGIGGGSTSSSAGNHRGRKGNVVYQHNRGSKGHSNEPEVAGKTKNIDGNRAAGASEQDSEIIQTVRDRHDRSDTKRASSYDPTKSLDNDSSEMNDTSLSLNCKNASSSTSGIEAGPSHESLSCPDEQLELSQEEREKRMEGRISYSREELLALKKHPLSQRTPKQLMVESIFVSESRSYNSNESTFDESRLKPLTPFSFLRDQESKQSSGSQRRGSDPLSRQSEREGSNRSLSRSTRDGRQEWRQPRNSRHDYQSYREAEEEPEPEWMEFGPTDRFDVIELKGFDKDELEREADGERSQSSEKAMDDTSLPEWEDEIVAENRDEGEGREEKKEEKERGTVKEGTQSREKGARLANEYILDGFDFSTGLSICQELALDEDDGVGEADAVSSLLQDGEVQTPVQLSNALMKALKVGGDERAELTSESKNQESKRNRPVNALTLDEIHARENIHPVGEASDKGSNDLGAFNKLVAVLQSSGDIKNEQGPPPLSLKKVEPQLPPQQRNQNQQLPSQAPPTRVPPYGDARIKPAGEHRASPTEMSNSNFGSLLEKELGFDEEGPTPLIKGPPPVIPSRSMAPSIYRQPTLTPPHVQQREYPPPPSHHPVPPTNLIGRGEPQATPQPSMSRLEAIAGMLEKLDQRHLHTAPYNDVSPNPVPPPPPQNVKMRMEQQQRQQQQQQLAAMHMERERERAGWRYPESYVDQHHMTPSPELLRSMPPPPRQLPGVGGRLMGPPPSSSRQNSNNWAIEMERRRVFELQQMQMRERERMFQRHQQQQHGMNPAPQGKTMSSGPGSKPNISLLPTSVMRHIHNTKPNHQLSDMTKTSAASAMSGRMDQDMMGKAPHSHSSMLNHSAESAPQVDYPPTSQMMSGGARENHAHSNAAMMYPNYSTSMPQRMSSQHNPYWY